MFRIEMWKRALLGGILLALLAGVAFLAFREDLFADPASQVPSAALGEVRSIGKVQAEGSYEIVQDISESGDASIANIFVLDLGSADALEAMRKATSLLQERGWHLIETDPTGASMTSAKWGTYLSVEPFGAEALRNAPDVLNVLQGKSVRTEALLVVDMFGSGG